MRRQFLNGALAAIALPAMFAATVRADPTLTTVYSFNDPFGISWFPSGALVVDAAGNLYGTTAYGAFTDGTFATYYGVAYELSGSNHQTMTVLVQLNGQQYAGLTADSAGNFYGTGIIGPTFELSGRNHQTVTTLTNFDGAYSGQGDPLNSQLSVDADGDIFGTAQGLNGAAINSVFEVSGSSHTVSTLYSFPVVNGMSSDTPVSTTIGADGNLYGTTEHGTVFELTGPNRGTLTTLASVYADGQLVEDSAGDLFGVNDQTAFELSGPNHQTLTMLATIPGYNPVEDAPALIVDAAGDLFGVASRNGGSVFELPSDDYQSVKTVASFASLGWVPNTVLTADSNGDLYGVSNFGGAYGDGAVFEITNSGFVVPEPSSLSLLAVCGVALLHRRRKLQRDTGLRPVCELRS